MRLVQSSRYLQENGKSGDQITALAFAKSDYCYTRIALEETGDAGGQVGR